MLGKCTQPGQATEPSDEQPDGSGHGFAGVFCVHDIGVHGAHSHWQILAVVIRLIANEA